MSKNTSKITKLTTIKLGLSFPNKGISTFPSHFRIKKYFPWKPSLLVSTRLTWDSQIVLINRSLVMFFFKEFLKHRIGASIKYLCTMKTSYKGKIYVKIHVGCTWFILFGEALVEWNFTCIWVFQLRNKDNGMWEKWSDVDNKGKSANYESMNEVVLFYSSWNI